MCKNELKEFFFSQNSPSLQQNSVKSLFQNSTLETVFHPCPTRGINLMAQWFQKCSELELSRMSGNVQTSPPRNCPLKIRCLCSKWREEMQRKNENHMDPFCTLVVALLSPTFGRDPLYPDACSWSLWFPQCCACQRCPGCPRSLSWLHRPKFLVNQVYPKWYSVAKCLFYLERKEQDQRQHSNVIPLIVETSCALRPSLPTENVWPRVCSPELLDELGRFGIGGIDESNWSRAACRQAPSSRLMWRLPWL